MKKKKMFANYISDKGLKSKIYRELIQLKRKKRYLKTIKLVVYIVKSDQTFKKQNSHYLIYLCVYKTLYEDSTCSTVILVNTLRLIITHHIICTF